jgi:limonene-1,2-epoxide hydrolase
MGRTSLGRGALGVITAILALAALAIAASDRTPEETVRRYVAAIQEQDFSAAYDLVSTAMKTDRKTGVVKSREVWVKESQYLVQLAAVKIFGFRVFPGRIEGEEAKVPNLLSSQDKFLNQLGVDEHELYTLVREDGAWKVDRQEIVIDRDEIDAWFAEPAKTPTIVP